MPFIGKSPTAGFATIVKDTLTANGSTTQFTLSKQVASATDIAVFVGNVRQEPTTAYTVNGTTLDFGSGNAPATGLDMYVLHIGGTQESSIIPADGTISTAKLVDDSVTGAKIENNPTIAGKITATGGITFGSDTAATNVLDDYEEGFFQVGIAVGGAEQPTRNCKYVKIGSVVHVVMQATEQNSPYFEDNTSGAAGVTVRVNTTAGTGQLPFTPKYSDQGIMSFTRGVRQENGTSAVGVTFGWGWQQGNTQLYLGAITTTGNEYNIYDGNVSSDAGVTLEKDNTYSNVVLASTFTYITDD